MTETGIGFVVLAGTKGIRKGVIDNYHVLE